MKESYRENLASSSGHEPYAGSSNGRQVEVRITGSEPSSALDLEMTAEVLGLIQELAEGGQDIIPSTRAGFARTAADQVAFVVAGKIEEISEPAWFFGAPESPICQRFLSRVMSC